MRSICSFTNSSFVTTFDEKWLEQDGRGAEGAMSWNRIFRSHVDPSRYGPSLVGTVWATAILISRLIIGPIILCSHIAVNLHEIYGYDKSNFNRLP